MKLEHFISVDDYLMGRATLEELTDEQKANLNTLIPRVNMLLEHFHRDNPSATKRSVTSGIRMLSDHLRIYEEKNKKLRDEGKPEVKVPMGSKHLVAGAVDLSDPDRLLNTYCMNNLKLLKQIDLYMENPDYTKSSNGGWCHLQCVPTRARVFNPY